MVLDALNGLGSGCRFNNRCFYCSTVIVGISVFAHAFCPRFDVFFKCAEKLLVILRDGRKIIGILRSFDQFGMGFLSMQPCC